MQLTHTAVSVYPGTKLGSHAEKCCEPTGGWHSNIPETVTLYTLPTTCINIIQRVM